MNKYSLRFYLNIFCLSILFLSVIPLNAQTTYTRITAENTTSNAVIEWSMDGSGISPDPTSADFKLYKDGADLGNDAIEVIEITNEEQYTLRVDLSKEVSVLPYNILSLRSSIDVDLTSAANENFTVSTSVAHSSEKYINDLEGTISWTYKRVYATPELAATDLKLYRNNTDEGNTAISVAIDDSGEDYTISVDLSLITGIQAGDVFSLTDASDVNLSSPNFAYKVFSITHPNNQEFNTEGTIEWTLKGSFDLPYPTSSDFSLFKNSSDEGSDELSIIEITAGEQYLIRADVSSFAPISDDDVFKLEGLNNGDLTGSDYTYIYDGTDPTISFALSTSSDSGFDNTDAITNKTSLFFDITTEFGSSIVVEDGSSNVLTSGTSTGTNTLYIPSISEGVYTLKVIVTDLAGNIKELDYPLTVDTTPITQHPTVPVITSSYNTGNDDANVVTSVTTDIEITINDLTSEAKKIYVLSDIKGNVGEETTISNPSTTFNIRLEDNGTHQLTTYIEDAAGNVTQSATNVSFVIDNVIPNKPQIALKESSQTGREESGVFYTSNTTPVFEITVDEVDMEIKLFGEKDNNPPTTLNNTETSSIIGINELTSSTLTIDGTYYYQATFYDKANNEISSDVITIEYAAEIDPLPISGINLIINNSLDASSTYTNVSNVELKFENVPNVSPYNELVILDESFTEITRIQINENDEIYTLSSLEDGEHKINYHFEDIYGNRNADTEFTFTVDTQAPTLTSVDISSDHGGNSSLATSTGDKVSLKIIADETLKNTSSMTINGGTPITSVTDNYTGTETIVDFSNYQKIPFSITAIDLAGNQTTITNTTDGSEVYVFPDLVNTIQNNNSDKYCETSEQFTLGNLNSSGGKGSDYVYEWFRKVGAGSFENLNFNGAEYTEYQELIPETYIYRRVIDSEGETVNADLTVEVYNALASNTISNGGPSIFFGNEVSENTIQLTGSTPTAGNGSSYSYEWETSDDDATWNTISSETSISLDYGDKITDETTYFRRKVTSGPCVSYSNSIKINLYSDIVNTIKYSGPSFYCSTSPSFILENDVISGGDGNYTIAWKRKKDSGSFSDLGINTNYYTEVANLSEGEYTYKRVVTSAGGTVESTEIDITIYDEIINNTISLQNASHVFFGADISDNTIVINEKSPTPSGGDNVSIDYTWELSNDGSIWNTISTEVGMSLTYATVITDTKTYFRRKVTSGSCELYSNVVEVNLYPVVTNTISYSGTVEFCGTNEVFTIEEDVTLTGGDNTYSIDWQRKKDAGSYATLNASAAEYTENDVLSTGVYSYRRVVTSAGVQNVSNEITITIQDAITNSISAPSKTIYVGEIAINEIIFSPSVVSGGGGSYTYDWQYFDGSIWKSNGSSLGYTHNEVISENSETKIRRVVTSGDCTHFSNEVTIKALPNIQNEVELLGASEYCETFSSYEIKNETLTGGDENYTFNWYRSNDGFNFSILSGETDKYYIENDALSAGQYTYKRVVNSAGETVESNLIVVDIYSIITENSIVTTSDEIFFATIPINTIEVETDNATAGGDGSFDYLWEIDKNDGNGYVSTGITTESLIYNQELNSVGEYQFRRVVNSVDCSNDYSNEVTITLYSNLSNFDVSLISSNEICEGGDIIISGSSVQGGDGSYTYKWYKRNVTNGTPFTKIDDATDVNYIKTNSTEIGELEFKREVNSAGQTRQSVVTVTVLGEPSVLTISPIQGSNYSNTSGSVVSTSVTETEEYYCTGKGIVSNGKGSSKNNFYPALAGEGDHEITFHIIEGSCEFTRTINVKVYDGSKVFSTISESYCEDGTTSTVKYDKGAYLSDDISSGTNSYETSDYKTVGIIVESEDGTVIKEYHSSAETTALTFDLDPAEIINLMDGKGLINDDISKLAFLKIYYNTVVDPSDDNLVSFSQAIDITLKPSAPEINNSNPTYCYDNNSITAFKVNDAIGNISWYDENDDLISSAIGSSYTPILGTDIIKEINSDEQYIYFVRQEVNGCMSDPTKITLDLFKETVPPTFENNDIKLCDGDDAPVLKALTGENIVWYDQSDDIVGTGEEFTPTIQMVNLTKNENYSFFARSTVNGCQSDKATVDIEVFKKPSLPEIDGPFTNSYCVGEPELDDLKVKKQTGEKFKWYKDENLTDQISGNDSEVLDLGDDPAVVGAVSYWVVKVTPNLCESDPLEITYEVFDKPEAPTLAKSNFSICSTDSRQEVEVTNSTGNTVYWFEDDPTLNDYASPLPDNDVKFTPAYNTNVSSDVVYTYYVAQKNANECFSDATPITVNVYALPDKPLILTSTDDRKTCSGEQLYEMEVSTIETSDVVNWYSDDALTNLLHTGKTFTPSSVYNVINDSIVTFYVTSTSLNQCVSEKETVNYEIQALPDKPNAGSIPSYCRDTAISELTVTGESGANFTWYSSEDLSKIIGNDNSLEIAFKAPEVTEIDSLHYWVTQTSTLGCESLPQKVSIPLVPAFDSPSFTKTEYFYCNNENIQEIVATGSFITWYEDLELNSIVSTQNNFTPNINNDNADDETLYFYVTQRGSSNGCESDPVLISITRYKETENPIVAETSITYCAGEDIEPLVVTGGDNIKWYSEDDRVNPKGTGKIFLPNDDTNVSVDTPIKYYVTETQNGCESEGVEIEIMIYGLPDLPVAETVGGYCKGENILPLKVVGETGAIFKWYSNEALTDSIGVSNEIDLGINAPDLEELDSLHYWVTQTSLEGCISSPVKVSVPIFPTPTVPTMSQTEYFYCNNDVIQPIIAIGNDITWYRTSDKKSIVNTGGIFTPVIIPNEIKDVTTTFYVTQKNSHNCESEPLPVTITIYEETVKPAATSTFIPYCSGESLQPIVLSEGDNIKWYDNEALGDENKVGSGKIYLPNDNVDLNEDTSIKYYVTETKNGCESEAEVIEIYIYALPEAPLTTGDDDYCEDDEIQPLTASGETGATFKWYDSENLDNVIGDEATVDLGITAPAFEELDSLHYWVTQTSTEGCTSLPQKVSIPVYPTPAKPTLSQTEYFYCNNENVSQIIVEGNNITWYSSEDLSTIITTGTTLTPSLVANEELDVSATYYVTQKNEKDCESEALMVSVTIYKETEKPIVENTEIEYCSGESLQPIVLTEGENIKWYSDNELTEQVGTGKIFLPSDNSSVSVDTSIDYYLTETENGCESNAQKVEIIIYALPIEPVASSVSNYCEGQQIQPLEVSGETGAIFKWYDNEALDNVIGEEATIDLGITAPAFEELDSLHYWVTQTSIEGCTSLPKKVSIPVFPTPSQPILTQTVFEYCNGEIIAPLEAEGTNITWYSDNTLTTVFSSGKTIIPPSNSNTDEDYILTYYVTQKNENLCESEVVEVKITVYKETIAPILSSTINEYCSNAVLQPIVVTGGENIRWYDDGTLSNQVSTGGSYLPLDDTDVSEDTSIDYYYTETKNGCESDPQRVEIIIYNTPESPVINGGNIVNLCSGDLIQPLIVTGQIEELKWYKDADLTEMVWEGNEFVPIDTTITEVEKSINYYVTNSHNSCESTPTEVTINLNPLPAIELLGISDNEIFCKSDVNPIIIATPSSGNLTSSTGAIIRNSNEILLATSSLGEHIIKYTYVNNNNCVDSVLRHFTIVDVPVVNFSETILCDTREVIFSDETIISDNDSLTEIIKWEYDFGENEGSITLNSAEEAKEYTHVFDSRGEKTITLTITTNQNCSEITFVKNIFINSAPTVDFTWKVSEFGKEMIFEEVFLNAEGDEISQHIWDFGDGTVVEGRTPKHQYKEVGTYLVTYTASTEKGCSNIVEKEVFVLPYTQLLSEEDSYFENFDLDNGYWTVTGSSSSWEYGIPTTTKFNSVNNAWVTGLDSTYLENEESFLNLPSFDISGLSKPMLSFDMKLDVEEGIDGIILQYSLDSGQHWLLLGDMNDPINWYNSQSILSDPGDQIIGNNTLSKGWTGTNTTLGYEEGEFFSVRHHLDDFLGEEHLRLRFIFKANSAQEYEGVVIDNFFIGNREKVVLVESMTNAAQEASNRAMSDLAGGINTMASDVLGINYHIYLEGYSDDLNMDNPEPSSGRKFFYGVINAPRTIVDGNAFQGHTDDFLKSYKNYIYSRTLLDPEFSLETDISNLSETGQIGVTLTAHKAFDAEDTEIVVHLVTLEKEIFGIELTDDITSHLNVMKSMSPAPGAEGTSFFGRSWKANSTETVYIDWANPAVYDTDKVELIAFVQDNRSKEIYQTMNIDLPNDLLNTDLVSSIDPHKINNWNLFPNPASSFVNVKSNNFVSFGYWEVSNVNGKKVSEGTFTGNQFKINVQGLPSGIYIIRNSANGEYISEPLKFVITK